MGVPLLDGCSEEDDGRGGLPDRGLNEADFTASVATLQSVAASLDAECVILR